MQNPNPRPPGHGTVHPTPVLGKLRHGEPSDLESGEGPRRCLAFPCPPEVWEAARQHTVDTALFAVGRLWHKPERWLSPTHQPPGSRVPPRRDLEASCDPQEPATGTSRRLQRAASSLGSASLSTRKFFGPSGRSDPAAYPVRGSLPPAPSRPCCPGAPANLTPPRHSGGRLAPLAMASLRAVAAPRSAPDARQRLLRASCLRRSRAAMRDAPRAAKSAELPTYSSRSRPVPSMPSAARRAARRRGAGRGVAAGFSQQPRARGGAGRPGEPVRAAGSARGGGGRVKCVGESLIQLAQALGRDSSPGLRSSTPRVLLEPRALISDAVVLGQRD